MKIGYINVLPKKCYTKATQANGLVRTDRCPNCNEWRDDMYWLGYENKKNHDEQIASAGFDGYIQANKLCEKCYNELTLENRSQVYMLNECIDI